MRNALCHDGIGFLPISTDENGKTRSKITDIIFEAKYKNGNIKFIAKLTIDQLEKILDKTVSLYCDVEKGFVNGNKEYRKFFKSLSDHAKEYLGKNN